MPQYSRDDIKRMCSESNVKFVCLQFTDIFGVLKSVTIPVEQLGKALDNQCMFDGSSVDGFVRIEESDMYLSPDPNTFVIFPWGHYDSKLARMICDVINPDGTPFEGDSRFILKKVLQNVASLGYDSVNVGPECEFFLFQTDELGEPTTITHDKAGYFDLGPVDQGGNARRDICVSLESMGFEIEASHHENAPGQHEIDFKYGDALTVSDCIMTFKYVVKTVANRNGLYATFIPKPIQGVSGSGMHVNLSLLKNNMNIFYDETDNLRLSQEAYWFIGGLLKYAREITAITNPVVNSYKRLVPDHEAPVYVSWSAKNRSPLIRIPAARGETTRIEFRSPDCACNPYLALAVVIQAGLEGIKNKIQPPSPLNMNIYKLTEQERIELGIDTLPEDLKEAILCMKSSSLVREVLGDHVFEKFIEAKTSEWNDYRKVITPWELNQYLTRF